MYTSNFARLRSIPSSLRPVSPISRARGMKSLPPSGSGSDRPGRNMTGPFAGG